MTVLLRSAPPLPGMMPRGQVPRKEHAMRCLALALSLLIVSPLVAKAAGKPRASQEQQRLLDKWIVRSVRIDGKPTAAQIGRKVGDIITIKLMGDAFVLS